MEQQENLTENEKILLTRIRGTYTLLDTQGQDAGEENQFIIENFLRTLAEVAVSITARKKDNEQYGKQNSNQ